MHRSPVHVIRGVLSRPVGEFWRRIGGVGAQRADGSPRVLPENVLEIDDGRGAAYGRLPHQRGGGKFLMFEHVGGGAVRERLTRLPGVIRYILVYVIDVSRWRERVTVLPVRIGRGFDLSVGRYAILELVPSMVHLGGRLAIFVLQGAVTAARVVRGARFFPAAVIPVRILQRRISGGGMAARVAAVAASFLNVHLLAPVRSVILCWGIRHRLKLTRFVRSAREEEGKEILTRNFSRVTNDFPVILIFQRSKSKERRKVRSTKRAYLDGEHHIMEQFIEIAVSLVIRLRLGRARSLWRGAANSAVHGNCQWRATGTTGSTLVYHSVQGSIYGTAGVTQSARRRLNGGARRWWR